MLLNFKMKNFKSFKNEAELSMIPSSIKDLEYSVIRRGIGSYEIKALSSAVIYGPNSAGKTNIISGMDVFRSIVLKGNINNSDEQSAVINPDVAIERLELVPNITSNDGETVDFNVKFYTKSMIFDFILKADFGSFLNKEYDRKIIDEELYINNSLIYKRTDKVEIGKLKNIEEFLIEGFSEKNANNIANLNLNKRELFLNGMFKNLYSRKLYEIIDDWFTKKFEIIYRSDLISTAPTIDPNDTESKVYHVDGINAVARNFGISSDEVVYKSNPKNGRAGLYSVISTHKGKKLISSNIFESFGTVRMVNLFPLIVHALENGSTLVIDEFDASIHPMAIMNIISIFHNDKININGAQLIFNTHNPIFLNKNLYRRDEIKFVEKEDKNTILYSLSDFGTDGKNGVRNSEDYMKNYFISKYGAINEIDFSSVFKWTEREE